MNPTRAELLHELVNTAIAEGRSNTEIRNRINSFTQPEERREAVDYLKLMRTRRREVRIHSTTGHPRRAVLHASASGPRSTISKSNGTNGRHVRG